MDKYSFWLRVVGLICATAIILTPIILLIKI